MKSLKPIERKPTISAEIIDQIVSSIRNGELKSGDILPSERELSETFKVGRSTVREAIMALEGTGILQRTSKGRMITDYSSGSHHKLWLYDVRANIRDVFEMRKMIDIEAAALAAKRSTPEDLKKISETLVDTIEFEEMIASDMSFHRAIVKATHNEIIFKVYNSVTGMLFQVYNYYSFLPEEETEKIAYVKEIYLEHKKILKAIESGKAGLAVESMREHFDFVEKTLLSNVSKNI